MNPKIKYLLDNLQQRNNPILFTKEEVYDNSKKTSNIIFFVEKIHKDNLELVDIGEYKTEKEVIESLSLILAKTITNIWPEN